MTRIAVLITCYNRRDQTVACLSALQKQSAGDISVTVYLVDDGCTDGTGSAAARFPNVHVLQGDGNLFWTRGMHLAFATALREGHDGYLWLNDDVVLDDDALVRLMQSRERIERRRSDEFAIMVGSTRDPNTGSVNYGGLYRLSRLRPLTFVRVDPVETELEVDTMEGNFVYIPDRTAQLVGNLDPALLCAGGDEDYGLRACGLGVRIWLMPGTIGTCLSNPPEGSWRAPGIGIRERWRRRRHPARGLPWTYWSRFARRHGGPFWLLYAVWAYRRLIWPTNAPAVLGALARDRIAVRD